MTTNQAETASAQSILEKVRELANRDEQTHPSSFGIPATQGEMEARSEYKDDLADALPEIASLVESQAKRNAELETENKLLREEWEKMKKCLEHYTGLHTILFNGKVEFDLALPARECLETLKFSPSQK